MGGSIGTLVGAGIGAAFGAPGLGATLGGAAGGLLGGSPDVSGAYSGAAGQQSAAAQQAAANAQFRPVGITTRFGQSNFQLDDQGRLTSAGYTVSPELKAIQDRLMTQAQSYDPTLVSNQAQSFAPAAQQLFGLGSQYLATSPAQARQDYMTTQLAALAPSREQQLANVRNRLFQTGRSGLATGGTVAGNMQATNPELAAYYNAIAQQDLNLAAGAEQQAQARTQFGAGLFGTGASLLAQIPGLTSAAYSPLQTQIGLAGTLENLGQQPLDLGAQLGGRSAQAGAASGQLLSQGASNAALTGLAGQIAQQGVNATRNTALTNQLGGIFANPQSGGVNPTLGTYTSNLFGGVNPALQSELNFLGTSAYNPFSGYYTGADGWGNYGE